MRDLQSCIRQLIEANASERITLPCAVRWNELRAQQVTEEPEKRTSDIVEVNRMVYPYKHKASRQQSLVTSQHV